MLHVIKSKSFASDGRLLKWVSSLDEKGIISDVFSIEDQNQKGFRLYRNGRLYKKRLVSRFFLKKYKGYLPKVVEYVFKFLPFVFKKEYKVIVFHDVQQYLNLLITLVGNSVLWKKKIIWDLHELPHEVLHKNIITRRIIKYLLENVDLLVYTNNERRGYILEKYCNNDTRYIILNNYPSKEYLDQEKSQLPFELYNFLNKDNLSYVLWMGAATKGRNFDVFFDVYKKYHSKVRLVIMGSLEDEFLLEIKKHKIEDKVFVKFVQQSDIIKYVDNAMFSVVLYNDQQPNKYYCEPNRLYQLICRKIPVIVGYNPTLRKTVEKYNAGIVLNDDGSDYHQMDAAFNKLINRKNNFYNGEVDLQWESQFNKVIDEIKFF